jgi:hypothetical protein
MTRFKKARPASRESEPTGIRKKSHDVILPQNLKKCPQEFLAGQTDCSSLSNQPVCGYDKTTCPNCGEKIHGIQYRNACTYCRMFDEEKIMKLKEATVYALGYEENECTQGWYEKD